MLDGRLSAVAGVLDERGRMGSGLVGVFLLLTAEEAGRSSWQPQGTRRRGCVGNLREEAVTMIVTWTVLHVRTGAPVAPWSPDGAAWWQAGRSSPGTAQAPDATGAWWSLLATWDDPELVAQGPPVVEGVDIWHVVLQPVSAHGDVVLAGGARPFDDLPSTGVLDGVAALLTVAGPSPDDGREREFFRRFTHVSRDIARAPGHLVSLVQAPAAGTGPVLTLSVWRDLAAATDWAYVRSRPHASAVPRQRAHRLVETSGSLRCAVLFSGGDLAELGDPLAGCGTAAVPQQSSPAGA